MDVYLSTKFVDLTKVLLDKAGAELTVTVLLETLQHVTDFESSIGRRFAMFVGIRARIPVLCVDLLSLTLRIFIPVDDRDIESGYDSNWSCG